MPHALIVDGDAESVDSLRLLIASERFTVAVAPNLRDARRQMALQQPDVVLLDVKLPDGNGMDLFDDPSLIARSEVVLITGRACIETSAQALRLGAADYLVKPIAMRQLQGLLSRIMKPAAPKPEVEGVSAALATGGHFGPLWGRSLPMQRVYEQILRVAATSVTVFITGESGTGKEMVAQSVHDLSRRRKQPFLAINCGAISPHLIESEVFGHEKGSFTGADRQHAGFFERASGGTLFLDEVTEMPLELQVKLLRVLETGRYMRVGGTQTQEADVRVIAATNRPPEQAVQQFRLREDLFYRLNVFPIGLPPLRERLVDVPLLAQHFLRAIGTQEGQARQFAPAALQQLASYTWPGNVRELRNVVQRAWVMAHGEIIDDAGLPNAAPGEDVAGALAEESSAGLVSREADAHIALPIGTSMAQAERALIEATLRHFNAHKERTAAVLGLSLKTLYNRLKEYAHGDARNNASATS